MLFVVIRFLEEFVYLIILIK